MLGIYRHFKGDTYTLLHVAYDHENGKAHAVYNDRHHVIWVRPMDDFLGLAPLLEDGKPVVRDGKPVHIRRFTYIGPGNEGPG